MRRLLLAVCVIFAVGCGNKGGGGLTDAGPDPTGDGGPDGGSCSNNGTACTADTECCSQRCDQTAGLCAPDPMACGAGLVIEPLPAGRSVSASLDGSSMATLTSACITDARPAIAYQLYLPAAKVVVASTEDPGTVANTIVEIRATDCAAATAEIACNDDAPGNTRPSANTRAMAPAIWIRATSSSGSTKRSRYGCSTDVCHSTGSRP
jgi:hypothetical protein